MRHLLFSFYDELCSGPARLSGQPHLGRCQACLPWSARWLYACGIVVLLIGLCGGTARAGQDDLLGGNVCQNRGLAPDATPLLKQLDSDATQQVTNPLDLLLQNELFALFAVLSVGLLLGRIEIGSLSLGSSGVIFAALMMGHLHYTIPAGVGSLGLVLFIYSVGLGAGPSFFSSFARSGLRLAQLTAIVVFAAALTVAIASFLAGIPLELTAGIFAGSLTSTPALAAALDSIEGNRSLISVGYGIAYPSGVIGIVLFVQLLPRLLRLDLAALGSSSEQEQQKYRIIRLGVRVRNPSLFGKSILSPQTEILAGFGFKVTRIMRDGKLVPITRDSVFEEGQVVLVVGDSRHAETVVEYFGESVDPHQWHDDELVTTRDTFVVTASEVLGRSLAELDVFKSHGVLVTRIRRTVGEFVPVASTRLDYADQLTVVGSAESLSAFARFVGHREKALQETDLYSLALGVLLGIFVGLIPLSLPGTKPIHLGLAGGTLVVALVLGHFGRIGRVAGRVPIAAQQVLREIGLLLFLAEAGVEAGGSFVSIVQQYGPTLFLVALVTTTAPLVIGYFAARVLFRIPVLEALGGLCGAMTSTPALGVMAGKVDSNVPLVSYATAYPVALVLKIAAIQFIVMMVRLLQ